MGVEFGLVMGEWAWMQTGRSPRFPYLTLEEALGVLGVIWERCGGEEMVARDAFGALGYTSLHGVAAKTLAAVKGYGLMEKRRGGKLRVTGLGRAILRAEPGERRLGLCREAALVPGVFRRIWQKSRRLTREELLESLAARGFTRVGAHRVSEIYAENDAFARLRELEEAPGAVGSEKVEVAEDAGVGKGEGEVSLDEELGEEVERVVVRMGGKVGGQLSLPLSCGVAVIPGGMTEEDYSLLLRTVEMWRCRLVGAVEEG